MEKFTKGEWKAAGFSVSCKGSGYIAKALEVFMDKSERTANAHLIAAAPKMYRSLQRQREGMLNLIEFSYVSERVIESLHHEIALIDEALAAARGES